MSKDKAVEPVVENPAEFTPEELASFQQALIRTKATAKVADVTIGKMRALVKALAPGKSISAKGLAVALSLFDETEMKRKEKKGDKYLPNTGKARRLLEMFETEGLIENVGDEKKSYARTTPKEAPAAAAPAAPAAPKK